MAYTEQPILASYIAKLVTGSLEADVDHMWSNILAHYFPTSEDYGIEREPNIRPRSQIRANVCVSTISQSSLCKVIMVENKRASNSASGIPPLSSWTHAKSQLLVYMTSCRTNQSTNIPNLIGIVGIGKYVQFFQLRQGRNQLEDYGDGLTYHLHHDRLAIEQSIIRMKGYIDTHR